MSIGKSIAIVGIWAATAFMVSTPGLEGSVEWVVFVALIATLVVA